MKKKNIPIDIIIALHEEGLYDREIAEIFGCERSNITIRLNKLGYKNRKSKIDDIELRNRISESLVGRYIGDANPNFKGYTTEKMVARGIFKTISKRMIRNANYTCQRCGCKGGNLETHHIKPFATIMQDFITDQYDGNINNIYEQLTSYPPFMDENNLIVLCEDCHKYIHSKDNHEPSSFD